MDPDNAVGVLRALIEQHDDAGGLSPDEVVDLINELDGLDNWLSTGGYLPTAWRNARPSAEVATNGRNPG